MSKRIFVFILIASLALNAAFIASWAGYRMSRGFADDRGKVLPTVEKHEIWCPLHRSLNVSKEQWQQLEPHLLEFRKKSQGICEQVNQKRSEMIDILSSADPDRQAITDKQKEIQAAQQKMQQLVIEHLLFEKSVLNSRQQEEFFQLFRRKCRFASGQDTGRKHSFRQILNPSCESPQADSENEQEDR